MNDNTHYIVSITEQSSGFPMQPLDSMGRSMTLSPELFPRGPLADSTGFLRVSDDSKVDIKPHATPRGHKVLPRGKYS